MCSQMSQMYSLYFQKKNSCNFAYECRSQELSISEPACLAISIHAFLGCSISPTRSRRPSIPVATWVKRNIEPTASGITKGTWHTNGNSIIQPGKLGLNHKILSDSNSQENHDTSETGCHLWTLDPNCANVTTISSNVPSNYLIGFQKNSKTCKAKRCKRNALFNKKS